MAKLTLQEQMLKAGLVNEKKLKKAKKGSKKSRVQAREAKAAAEENKLAQQAKDKELNQQLKEKQLSKEIKAQSPPRLTPQQHRLPLASSTPWCHAANVQK